jgi:tRNA nucleotidyltransferase (CCA-adding enzyme)
MNFPAPPAYVLHILRSLESAGFRAYPVGGCVRDMVMGKRPSDWDLCTSAGPEEVMSLFARAEPSGLRHGTVTVHIGRGCVEVTTFRADGVYRDHRRPESVRFVSELEEDLRRRDFTVNAMALSSDGQLIDPFGGREDIDRRLIRCVGAPDRRFGEDALRMFRALRFAARLGFAIEHQTAAAITKNAPSAAFLAPERIRVELEKILLSDRPALIGRAIGEGLLAKFLTGTRFPAPETLKRLPKKSRLRWAGLCALLLRDGLIENAESFLSALRLDGASIRHCAAGAALAVEDADRDDPGRKRILARNGEDTALCCAAAGEALGRSKRLAAMRAVMENGECRSLRTLAVNGDDLLALGFSGPALGEALWALLEHVLEHPYDNERAVLLALAQNMRVDEDGLR